MKRIVTLSILVVFCLSAYAYSVFSQRAEQTPSATRDSLHSTAPLSVSENATSEPLRWAVISGPSSTSKSLADLLLAELSSDHDFHFVDRDNVHKVIQEQEMNALFGNTASEARLQLGQLLKADRLIVFSETNQIYIFDTKYGLSLFNLPIEFNEGTMETTCKDVAAIVRSVKDRYNKGVHTIVAVSYFVSKSFDRSYDQLQSELPNLLNRTLLQHDGVAVVAFDEIDKIISEYALTDHEPVKDRPVALKVTGEVSATMKSPQEISAAPQDFSLIIELRDNDRILETIRKENLHFHELGPFLSTDVVGKILNLTAKNTMSLSIEEQKSQFLKDAIALDAVGAKDLALNMREAVFFLDPDDLDNTVDILMGPCQSQKWTGFSPSPLKDRYRAIPFLEHAFKSKKLKLMHGLQLVYMVIKTTERYPDDYFLDKTIVQPPPLDDDPLGIGNDLVFFQRFFPLLMQLPTDHQKDGPSRTRTDWNGISVQVYNYGPAEQYRTVSQYLDNLFYDGSFEWLNRTPANLLEWKLKPNLNKNAFRAMFEMRRSLPKEAVLWSPGFLFQLPARTPKDTTSFEYGCQEGLLQGIPRDLWMYYCDLWRSTGDEDFILLADLYELYWLAFNKYNQSDWEEYGIAKIRKIFENYWSETEPGVFVPKEQKLSTFLMYLRSLEIVKGLADAKLNIDDPGTNLVYKLNISSKSMGSEIALKEEFKTLAEFYLRLNYGNQGGNYYHLKNDFFQFRVIPDWDVSLDKNFLRYNKWHLSIRSDPGKNAGTNGRGTIFQQNYSGTSLPGLRILTRNTTTNADWRIEKLDESADILWTFSTMYRLSRKEDGKIDYHFLGTVAENDRISNERNILDVKSDGKYIWSVIGPGRHGESADEMALQLLDREGRLLCKFDVSDGLQTKRSPMDLFKRINLIPHVKNGDLKDRFDFRTRMFDSGDFNEWLEDEKTNGAVSVYPLVPGKAVVVGRQGSLLQTWIGIATYDESTGEKNFKMLYGATRNITKDDLETLDTPAQKDINFSYPWLCPFRDSKYPERNQVLIGRRFGNYDNSLYATPLLVDLDEEKVMLLTERYPDLKELKGAVSIQCVNDVFVLRRGYRTIEIYHRNDEGRYVRQEIESQSRMDLYLFHAGNAVYAPGSNWYRIDVDDPNMPKCEVIGTVDCTIPTYEKLYRFAPSALFGVWALPRSGDPYMFDPTPVDKDFLPFEAFVPKDQLAKHDAAVKRLRELGATIGHSSYGNRVFTQNGEYCDGMFAYFNEKEKNGINWGSWKGTSDDIALLKDVYDLRSVGFVNVELGLNEVEMLANIPTITELALLSTGVSDAEFAMLPLENYSNLVISEYQKPARLTDKSLERFRGLSNIQYLNFSGTGFTDAAYDIIKTMPNLRLVHCSFGSMSEETRNKINK